MESLLFVLEAAQELKLHKVYWPSSIAAFGPTTPKQNTPQDTIMDPTTVYGITKLAGGGWCGEFFFISRGGKEGEQNPPPPPKIIKTTHPPPHSHTTNNSRIPPLV